MDMDMDMDRSELNYIACKKSVVAKKRKLKNLKSQSDSCRRKWKQEEEEHILRQYRRLNLSLLDEPRNGTSHGHSHN
jgi:hypothetical protein